MGEWAINYTTAQKIDGWLHKILAAGDQRQIRQLATDVQVAQIRADAMIEAARIREGIDMTLDSGKPYVSSQG